MSLVRVVELTGDTNPDIRAIKQADVIVGRDQQELAEQVGST